MADNISEEELRLKAKARLNLDKKQSSWSDVAKQAIAKGASGAVDTLINTPENAANLVKMISGMSAQQNEAMLGSEDTTGGMTETEIPPNRTQDYLQGQGVIDPSLTSNMSSGQKVLDTGLQAVSGAALGGGAKQAVVAGLSAAGGQGVTEATGSEGAGLLTSLLSPLAGSKISVLNQARDQARSLNAVRDETLRKARDLNFVVVPEHGIIDILDRPAALKQAVDINQHRTNEVARKYVGLPDNEAISADKLGKIRKTVYNTTYEPIKKIGGIIFDQDYTDELDLIEREFTGQSNTFPRAVSPLLRDLVDRYRVSNGTTEDVIDKIRKLRERATKYINSDIPDNEEFGFAQQKIADALENVLDREIGRKGWPSTMMDNYRNGRRLIARTYSVQSALNKGSGDISGKKLSRLLEKNIPIDGDLRTVAEFNLINKPRNESNSDLVKLGFVHAAGLGAGFSAAQYMGMPPYAGSLLALGGAAAVGGARKLAAKPAIDAAFSRSGQEALAPRYEALGIDPASGALSGMMFQNAQGEQQ